MGNEFNNRATSGESYIPPVPTRTEFDELVKHYNDTNTKLLNWVTDTNSNLNRLYDTTVKQSEIIKTLDKRQTIISISWIVVLVAWLYLFFR